MSLIVDNVSKEFRIRKGLKSSKLRAVNNVSLTLEPGKTIAIVGGVWFGKVDNREDDHAARTTYRGFHYRRGPAFGCPGIPEP